jgi:hypothetical protein
MTGNNEMGEKKNIVISLLRDSDSDSLIPQ